MLRAHQDIFDSAPYLPLRNIGAERSRTAWSDQPLSGRTAIITKLSVHHDPRHPLTTSTAEPSGSKEVFISHISFCKDELKTGTLHAMLTQLGLTRADLTDR